MRQQTVMFDEQLAAGRKLDAEIEANMKELGFAK
jgi:hypothetical protein